MGLSSTIWVGIFRLAQQTWVRNFRIHTMTGFYHKFIKVTQDYLLPQRTCENSIVLEMI